MNPHPLPYAITGVTLLEDGIAIPEAVILVEDGRIRQADRRARLSPTPGIPQIDGTGWLAAPGFIDLQCNGAYGFDFTASPGSIEAVAQRLPESGVTAFLPTFITSPIDDYAKKLEAVREMQQAGQRTSRRASEVTGLPHARVLGAHVEGPFLSSERRGAHNPSLFLDPELTALEKLVPLEAVRLVTLAAETQSGLEAVRWLKARGIVVSIGHSNATSTQALTALEAGVTYATHLFNAMPGLHHREPGLVGTLLTERSARCGLIVDGIHVHPGMVRLAYQCLGMRKITLVTDAMAAMGMPPGQYRIGDQDVSVDDTGARLESGTLAGSILRMDQAVQNMAAFCGCSLAEAARMASTTPAEVLGIESELGHLGAGCAADLVLLDPTGEVQATLIGGSLAYARSEEIAGRLAAIFGEAR